MTLSSDGTYYSVTGYTGTSTEVTINESYKHLPVKQIGNNAFGNKTTIGKVTIPSSITFIGSHAFSGCTGLTSVSIPSSVKTIGTDAFFRCTGLTSVSIPSSVTNIQNNPFTACDKLASISVNEANPSYSADGRALFNKEKTSLISYANASGTDYSIPSTVTSIEAGAFTQCPGLANVTISSSVKSIGTEAFCLSGLTSISIPSSVTEIETQAFWGCSSLARVSVPLSVTNIGECAFNICEKLASFSVDASNPSYSSDEKALFNKNRTILVAYANASGTDYSIPSTVTSIQDSAFENCITLKAINIPSSVTNIESSAFRGCTSLTNVMTSASITGTESNASIGNDAFYGCQALKAIAIPSGVVSIGGRAFYGCTGLTSVSIPSSVTDIGSWAFDSCSSLTSVSIPSSVTSIGSYAFSNCTGLTSVSIPSSVTSVGEYAFLCCTTLAIFCQVTSEPQGWNTSWNYDSRPVTWGAANRGSVSTDSMALVTNWDLSQSLSYSGTTASVDVPSSISGTAVTEISGSFLSDNTAVAYLRLPSTIAKIDAGAVSGCTALTTVIINAEVASIGSGAFANDTAVEACCFLGTPEQWAALAFTTFGDSIAYYSEADKSSVSDHYYWHYDTDGKTPVLWNA